EAATAAAQLVHEVHGEPGTGRADRVAERDRAAVDVDLLRVQAELVGGHQADRGERFVDLDQVERAGGELFLGQRGEDGVGRLLVQARVRPGDDSVRADLGNRRDAELLGLRLAGDDDRGGAVGDLRGGPGGDGAVRRERGAQLRQALGGGVGTDTFVGAELHRVT